MDVGERMARASGSSKSLSVAGSSWEGIEARLWRDFHDGGDV